MLWWYRWQCQLLQQNKTVAFESNKFIYNTGCTTPLPSFPRCLLSQNVIKPCFHAAKKEILEIIYGVMIKSREANTSFLGVNSFTTLGCRTPLPSFPRCLLSQNIIRPCFHAAKSGIIRNHLRSDDQGKGSLHILPGCGALTFLVS